MGWDRAGAWNSGIQGLTSVGGTQLIVASGYQLLLPNGSAAAPSLVFTGQTDLGIYKYSGEAKIGFSAAGMARANINTGGFDIFGNFLMRSDTGFIGMGASLDIGLYRDAANTLALKNANNEQQFNIYSGNGAYGAMISKQELVTLTGASTACTGNGIIPKGATLLSVSSYVETAITGASGYTIGDADADRFGSVTGTIVGTHTSDDDWTIGTIEKFITATAIVLTAKTSNFTGGKIRVTLTYIMGSQATS